MMLKIFSITPLLILLLSACAGTATTQSDMSSDLESPGSNSYVIGPGDLLRVSVWKEEGMQQEVLVKPDGGISFPLIGEIMAGGKTTDELKQSMVSKLTQYIPNPVITVSVLQSNSNKIYVVGKVNRPGEFVTTSYTDVLQALSLAGGLTPFADSDEIKIIRRTNGSRQIFQFDYDDVISGDRMDMNIILKAGDTVVIP